MGNREAMQPRKKDRAEADTALEVAGSKTNRKREVGEIPSGSIERGERTNPFTAGIL